MAGRRNAGPQDHDPPEDGDAPADGVLRLDKWLWFARVVKTRTLATGLVTAGHVRVNGSRTDAPGKRIRAGDVLTISLPHGVRVLRVEAQAERREGYALAQHLYSDLTPPAEPQAQIRREPWTGDRRDRKDRRV